MVGRQAFPFGKAYFRGQNVSFFRDGRWTINLIDVKRFTLTHQISPNRSPDTSRAGSGKRWWRLPDVDSLWTRSKQKILGSSYVVKVEYNKLYDGFYDYGEIEQRWNWNVQMEESCGKATCVHFKICAYSTNKYLHPRSLTARPWKIVLGCAWKMILSYWVSVTFQGLLLLNFGRVTYLHRVFHYKPFILGYPDFSKHPYVHTQQTNTYFFCNTSSHYNHVLVGFKPTCGFTHYF